MPYTNEEGVALEHDAFLARFCREYSRNRDLRITAVIERYSDFPDYTHRFTFKFGNHEEGKSPSYVYSALYNENGIDVEKYLGDYIDSMREDMGYIDGTLRIDRDVFRIARS